ncbi:MULTISPECIES: hypothetical protein [unclassified Clostridioides]|uniref:hypothetical protein n=2 Tax=Clostridioides TaxID=1870884 RepID=UPI001D0FDE88|nr:hypothetical protein [Clostridioides sp. ES-S-0145-01]MCC0681948.1 hypothetical protein [Clostridioides sp. ES-S-0005-03]MCC0709297.1 hypothetical protein [Clostridioides sp. ES-S-0190-01]UDN64140.1 hypothetical protein IC758_19915 [Clostridioides sp. ES-W-0016-02]
MNLNTLKNNKGFTSLEVAIFSIIFLICIAGIMDFQNMQKKFNSISSTSTYISRVVGHQGGIRTSVPSNYLDSYVTSQKLYQDVKYILGKAGIAEEKWKVYINGYELSPDLYMPIIGRGTNITTQLKFSYDWDFLSQIIPIEKEQTKISMRNTISTFKLRESSNIDTEIK